MAIRKISEPDLEEAISFVYRLNLELPNKISYFGDTQAEIRADFSALQPPEGYAFLATGADESPAGFFGVETDLGLGRSWLFGPLVEDTAWDRVADQLYASIVASLPAEITDQEIFCHNQNQRVQDFAKRHGFTFSSEGAVLTLDIAQRAFKVSAEAPELIKEFIPEFTALHADLFPNTYYSAEQLIGLSREQDKRLMIHLDEGKLVGYVFVQARPASRDGYIDFIGVAESHRRQGIGRGLAARAVDWATQKSFVERITLTVNGDNQAAINLYHSMGFITENVSRAFRKRA